MTNQQQGTV